MPSGISMQESEKSHSRASEYGSTEQDACFHCGDPLPDRSISEGEKAFCCQGCATVYSILSSNDLCDYYDIDTALKGKKIVFEAEKYAFLDLPELSSKLIRYQDEEQVRVLFHIPHIHCSSCIYLLENLPQLHPGFLKTEINFPKKELTVVYNPQLLTLRESVEWLSRIGYEPYLSLKEMDPAAKPKTNKETLIKLGIAAFAFGNIMLLSFPEYLGASPEASHELDHWFRYIALVLSIPVVFYSAGDFFVSAWKSIRHGFLNIDAPIALAVAVTFLRSVYEVTVHQAPGYFDSMTGIVFFMLIGRYVQGKTYEALQFERDYKSYFPLSIPVKRDGVFKPMGLHDLQKNDCIRIANGELVPADGIVYKGRAYLDYSFVTGESEIIEKEPGQLVYAGARHSGEWVEIQLLQPVSHSYLTSLWNKDIFSQTKERRDQWLDKISHFFTWLVLGVAALTAVYWAIVNSSMILNTVTAVLIIACPCTILLTASFTNGFLLNAFSKSGLFVRSAAFLEILAKPDAVVLDKTGTITNPEDYEVGYEGHLLSEEILTAIRAITARTSHPLSKIVHKYLKGDSEGLVVSDFQEYPGQGLSGLVGDKLITLGNARLTSAPANCQEKGSVVHVNVDGQYAGTFFIRQKYRQGIERLFKNLQNLADTWIISGDVADESTYLQEMTNEKTKLLFNQLPDQKLAVIEDLQKAGQKVIMVGDGLNDSGALRQSDFGIAVTASLHNFTPASDAIIRADKLPVLDRFVELAARGRQIIVACFSYSLLYNIIGIYFAVNGLLTPLLAAIIMPASSLSIIFLSWIMVRFFDRKLLGKSL